MFRRLFGRDDLPSMAETYRRGHGAWLTRALDRGVARGPESGHRYPRIPLRKVDDGGFSGLVAKPGGRLLAEMWWTAALDRVDD